MEGEMKVELVSITPDAEKLIETAGRISHLSYDKQTEDSYKEFIKRIIKLGHFSILEHAYATFKISGISRACSHQLVRHRICSFTQQSQRYVDESNFEYIIPDSVRNNLKAYELFTDFVNKAKSVYIELLKLGIKKEDARYVLPNATTTQIIMTANFREWRHIIELRGNINSQWEIRRIMIEILKILKSCAPNCFGDFEIDEERETIIKKES
jgi:thymidylate synthase (FAD)